MLHNGALVLISCRESPRTFFLNTRICSGLGVSFHHEAVGERTHVVSTVSHKAIKNTYCGANAESCFQLTVCARCTAEMLQMTNNDNSADFPWQSCQEHR